MVNDCEIKGILVMGNELLCRRLLFGYSVRYCALILRDACSTLGRETLE